MMPKGEHEQDFLILFEGLEQLGARYQQQLGALNQAKRQQRTLKLLKRGHVLQVMQQRRHERAVRERNRQMRAAMLERRGTQTPDEPQAKNYFSTKRIAVYTSLFGAYDDICEPLICPDNIDYYIVTDQELPADSAWQPIDASVVPPAADTGIARNRWAKMHPHLLFPNHEYSLYLDCNCWIVSDLTPLIATLESYPVAMFPHKNRDCVYDEVEACLLQRKDDPESLEAHRRALAEHGVARHAGLLEATVIARKHHAPESVELMQRWWQEFCSHSNRDQIGLADCLWQMDIPANRLATLHLCGTGTTAPECSLFVMMPHRSASQG